MEDIPIRPGIVVPGAELELRTSRSGGPGGQGVNTTDSKVELRWDLASTTALSATQRERAMTRLAPRLTDAGVLILTGSEHRSQHRNREAVIARFRSLVGEALEPPRARRPTRPTRGSQERRLRGKQQRAETKRLRRPPQA